MTVLQLNSKATVESLGDGRIAVWAGDETEQSGVVMWPAAALETARDLMAEAMSGRDVPAFEGAVEHVAILPPAEAGLTSCLTLTVAGRPVNLLLRWEDLHSLAAAAQSALNAATPAGST